MSQSETLFHVNAAGLLATYWCNARCAHCYERSGPHKRGWITADAARRHFAAMRRMGIDEAGIHIGGGEPFGDFQRLTDIMTAGHQAGLSGYGYIETNGYWATSDSLTIDQLTVLKDFNVRQVSLSVDVYHQAHVDPQGPLRLARLARQVLGPRGLRVRRWRCLEAPQDLRLASADELRTAYIAAMARYPERMTGRAVDELAPLLPGLPASAYSADHCRRALLESGHLHVDPQGYVYPGTCAGLLLGQADENVALDEVLHTPRGTIWQLLVEAGPAALAAMASKLGYCQRPQGYADKCHLCTDVRRWLFSNNRFPAELGPSDVYNET